jgi:ABC-2 type transport system permease protein
MSRLRRPRVNPVLRRELLERWRSRRAPITLTLYLAVLGGALYLLYRVGLAIIASQFGFGFGPGGGGGPDATIVGPLLGRFLLESLLFFVLLLVLFVAPGYAAAQLSGERERRTLSLLQVTLLAPHQIVLGKLGAAVAWLTLLVVATLPLGAAAFFLGGVALGDLLRGVGYILVIGISVAGMAIGISSLTRRTTGSIVLTYGLVLALTVGSLFVALAELVIRSNTGRPTMELTPVALHLNPAFGLADAVTATRASDAFMGGATLPSPLSMFAQALPRDDAMRRFEQGFGREIIVDDFGGAFPAPFPGDMEVFPDEPFPEAFPGEPFPGEPFPGEPFPGDRPAAGSALVWLRVMGLYLALGLVGLLVANLRLRGRQVSARLGRRRRSDGETADPGATATPAPSIAAEDGR